MRWSWQTFVDTYRIPYESDGPSTAKGNIYIECPFCRNGKKYLGLSETSPVWGCWKTSQHAGRTPERLVQALLGLTRHEATQLVSDQSPARKSLREARERLQTLTKKRGKPLTHPEIDIPRGIPLRENSYATDYLKQRGFDPEHLEAYYKLTYTPYGDYACRIILPIIQNAVIINFTARAIHPNTYLRYKTHASTTDMVYNHDNPKHKSVLIIVEGPFDALKLDQHRDIHAVALLGLQLNARKADIITKLIHKHKYNHVGILLDQKQQNTANHYRKLLLHLKPKILILPRNRKDPGELTMKEVEGIHQDLT